MIAVVRTAIALFNLMMVTTIIQVALALPMVIYFHGWLTRIAQQYRGGSVDVRADAGRNPCNIVELYITGTRGIPVALTALVLHGITGTVRHLGGVRFADVRIAMPTMAASLFTAAAFAFAMFARAAKNLDRRFERCQPVCGGAIARDSIHSAVASECR